MESGTQRCPVRIAVVSLKGGVGKTITAVHLAVGFSERGSTLLVDADPYRSASRWSEKAGERFPCPVVTLPGRSLHWQLPELARGHDHLVIDTPPNDEAVARSAILAATSIVYTQAFGARPAPHVDYADVLAEIAATEPALSRPARAPAESGTGA